MVLGIDGTKGDCRFVSYVFMMRRLAHVHRGAEGQGDDKHQTDDHGDRNRQRLGAICHAATARAEAAAAALALADDLSE